MMVLEEAHITALYRLSLGHYLAKSGIGMAQQKGYGRAQSRRIASSHHMERSGEPPWVVTIFTGSESLMMLLSIHHSIRDEQSLEFIMEDLHKAYSLTDIKPRHQLRDAISLLRVDDHETERDTAFWAKSLHNLASTESSWSWPELKLSNEKTTSGTLTHKWTSTQSYKTLQARITRTVAVSIASLLRVAWGHILLQYLETDNTVFGETRSTRGESPTLADVVGPLLQVVPVPIDAREYCSARQLLRADAEFHDISRAHHGVHPSVISKYQEKTRERHCIPLFSTLYLDQMSAVYNLKNLCGYLWTT